MVKILPEQTYDFSHLYSTQTFEVTDNNGVVIFEVTAKQIAHGAHVDIQKNMLGNLHVPKNKKDAEKQITSIQFDVTAMTDKTNIASIKSWTFEIDGKPIPVCIEAWRALPKYVIAQIEEGIKVLNPELDEDFQD